jgi:phage terminase small subunit
MLNKKQLRFIDEYMIDFSAAAAYVRAGYSPNNPDGNAYKMLQNPLIAEEIKRRQDELSKNSSKTREDIVNSLEQVVDQFLLDGRLTPNALKAIEILNKMKGWNEPEKQEITHKGITINILKPNNKNEQ